MIDAATEHMSSTPTQLEEKWGFAATNFTGEPNNLIFIHDLSFADAQSVQKVIYGRFKAQHFTNGNIPDPIDESLQRDPQVVAIKTIESFLMNKPDIYFSDEQRMFPAFLYSREELRAV